VDHITPYLFFLKGFLTKIWCVLQVLCKKN